MEINDCHQITLTEYMSWKQEIQERLNQSANNFVNIGYLLKKIRDTKAYEQDGFETLTEWAKATYNLTAPSVSRFIKINDEYSEEGYSRLLKREYEGYGYNQLYEMLAIPEADRSAITPATTVQEIREVKKFEKEFEKATEQPEQPVQESEFDKAVRSLMEGRVEVLEASLEAADTMDKFMLRFIKEELMPNGTKNVRSGTTMLMLGDEQIKVKKFAAGTEVMDWQQFLNRARPVMEMMLQEAQKTEPEEPMNKPVETVENSVDSEDFDIEIETEKEPEKEQKDEPEEPASGREEQEEPEAEKEKLQPDHETMGGTGQDPKEKAEKAEKTKKAAVAEPVEVIPPEDTEVVTVIEDTAEMVDSVRDLLAHVKNKNWESAMEQLEWLTDQVRTKMAEEA